MDCFALYEQLFKTEATIIAMVVNATVEPSLVDTGAGRENFTKNAVAVRQLKSHFLKWLFIHEQCSARELRIWTIDTFDTDTAST